MSEERGRNVPDGPKVEVCEACFRHYRVSGSKKVGAGVKVLLERVVN